MQIYNEGIGGAYQSAYMLAYNPLPAIWGSGQKCNINLFEQICVIVPLGEKGQKKKNTTFFEKYSPPLTRSIID